MSEETIVRSACRMCHGVCQVKIHLEGDRVVKISGDPDSPLSRGHICPKGVASPELLYHSDRVIHPLRRVGKRGENRWERISWDEALTEMAEKLSTIKHESGPEYFALAQGTGRPYTDFTSRFINAFGSPNFTGIAHICYMPRVFASVFSMGTMQPPVGDIYDLEGQKPACIVMWGSNVTHNGGAQGTCGGMVKRALKTAKKVLSCIKSCPQRALQKVIPPAR